MRTQHLGEFFVVEGPAAAWSRTFVALEVPAGGFAVCRRSTWGPLWWDRVVHAERGGAEASAAAYALTVDHVQVAKRPSVVRTGAGPSR